MLTEFSKRCQEARDKLTETDAQYRDRACQASTVWQENDHMVVVWYKCFEDQRNGNIQRSIVEITDQ